jgi:hypothetical protein
MNDARLSSDPFGIVLPGRPPRGRDELVAGPGLAFNELFEGLSGATLLLEVVAKSLYIMVNQLL